MSAVESADTAMMSRRTVMASDAVRPDSSNDRVSNSCSVAARPPWPADSSSSSFRSPGECAIARSSWGSTPTARTTRFAIEFMNQMTGRNTVTNALNGRANFSAESSGCEIAHDFGAISPTTMWRNTTIDRAIANPTMCDQDCPKSELSFRKPTSPSTPSKIAATAGSATRPRPSEHIVMPSCAPASINVNSRIAGEGRLGLLAAVSGELFDSRTSRCEERELGSDEEPVEREQHERQDQGGAVEVDAGHPGIFGSEQRDHAGSSSFASVCFAFSSSSPWSRSACGSTWMRTSSMA